MGNGPSDAKQMKKIQNQQDYQEFVSICQNVIKMKSIILKGHEKSFKGHKLCKILVDSGLFPEVNNTQLANEWVQTNLMNPMYPYQLIHPADESYDFCFDENKDYMFMEDKIDIYENDPQILNLQKRERPRPFFYEQDVLKFYHQLKDPASLVITLRILYQGIKVDAMHEGGTVIDYELLGNLDKWLYDFQDNLALLPFADLTVLQSDENEKLATFINLYNVLIVNAIVHFGKLHNNRFIMTTLERTGFFQKYKYNIGGLNFSLDDIEHGILRLNDAFGVSKAKQYWVQITKQTLSDKSKPRFSNYDPRLKFTFFSKKEPRIHFCLNCGFKSCPPIRVYDGKRLEVQLNQAAQKFIELNVKSEDKSNVIIIRMSKIFQWYKNDFGEEDIDVLRYISTYSSGELLENIQKILIGGKQYSIVYNEYDWSANYKKKPPKKDSYGMDLEETQMSLTNMN